MSMYDLVNYITKCPKCGDELTSWKTFDGPGNAEEYRPEVLMRILGHDKLQLFNDHMCDGQQMNATCWIRLIDAVEQEEIWVD